VSDASVQTPAAILEKLARHPDRGQHYDGCIAAVAVCFISWHLRRHDEQATDEYLDALQCAELKHARKAAQTCKGYLDYTVDNVLQLDDIRVIDETTLLDHAGAMQQFHVLMRSATVNGAPLNDVCAKSPTTFAVVSPQLQKC
jgi:hypothetical protein